MRNILICFSLGVFVFAAAGQEDNYTGPRPPKPDIPYLMHADNLIPAETGNATEDSKKDETTYTVAGASSPARTPLAEPIFLFQSDKINPDRLEMYKMEVKNGKREVTLSENKRRGARPLHITVRRLDTKLYQVEAAEMLEDGEYVLSPDGSDIVFCFSVY